MQRVEEREPPWMGHEPLWLVAPHVPAWLKELYRLVRIAPGCFLVEPSSFQFLWIAANDLPLRDDLVPFLVARSGQALDEFVRWVAPRRPLEWVLTMLEYLAMSTTVREELLWRFAKTDDPEIAARQDRILEVLLSVRPQVKERLVEEGAEKGRREGQLEGQREGRLEGHLTEARAVLGRLLARRQLTPSPEEKARIEACTDLATLHRWLDQAVTASCVSEALR